MGFARLLFVAIGLTLGFDAVARSSLVTDPAWLRAADTASRAALPLGAVILVSIGPRMIVTPPPAPLAKTAEPAHPLADDRADFR